MNSEVKSKQPLPDETAAPDDAVIGRALFWSLLVLAVAGIVAGACYGAYAMWIAWRTPVAGPPAKLELPAARTRPDAEPWSKRSGKVDPCEPSPASSP